jgi:hypothetical protein
MVVTPGIKSPDEEFDEIAPDLAVGHIKRAPDCFGRLVEMPLVDLGDLLQQLRGNSAAPA